MAAVLLGIGTAVTTAVAASVVAEDERAAAAVPEPSHTATEWMDGAPAVVLLQRGEIWPTDPTHRAESVMHVTRRVRILDEVGAVQHGLVVIPTSPAVRLAWFEGSTTTRDGEVIALPTDSIFHGRREGLGDVVTAVFPKATVGATLDYRYELRYATRVDIDPWFFQEKIPVLHSELRYHVPLSVKAGIWHRLTPELEPAYQASREQHGRALTFALRNLPAVANVPFAPPFADRAAQVLVWPRQVTEGSARHPLFDRWESVAAWYGRIYDELPLPRRSSRRALLPPLVAGVPQDEPIARALYEFVRDEVETSERQGIWVQSDASLERVLATRRGSATEKVLLLECLLREAGLSPRRIWAGDRSVREVDPHLPNPMQLGKLLLLLELDRAQDRAELFLDPSDRRLPFGHLLPENEGVWGVPVDAGRATPFRLPVAPADGNRRRLRIELAVDASGRLHGRGELVVSGHHALPGRSPSDSLGRRYAAWVDWLRGAFEAHLVQGLHLEEAALEQRLALHWDLTPDPRAAASDRADVVVNRPDLAPVWPVQVEQRRTLPVVLPFAGRDELEVRVTWERGFEPDRLPAEIDLQNMVGRLRSRLEVSLAERRLVYQRTFAIDQREVTADALGYLRDLLEAKLQSDADTVGLARIDS